MKMITTLLIAAACCIGVQVISAKPAEAFGWCGWGGRYVYGYRSAPVRYYRPVRRVRYYSAPGLRRSCWWW
jgi:hypothetical protein